MPDAHQTTRHDRRSRGQRAIAAFEQKHPRLEHRFSRYFGPRMAWDDLLGNWWTAAEWLARWKRGGQRGAIYRPGRDGEWRLVCPPRPWVLPDCISLRAGRKVRKLP
jgi:hypothetical protein